MKEKDENDEELEITYKIKKYSSGKMSILLRGQYT